MSDGGSGDPRQARVRVVVLASLAAVALAVWGTWPVATCLRHCVVDPVAHSGFVGAAFRRDVDLVVWILAWGAHALTTRPWGIFDANLFHPAPASLATTEHLLGLQPVYLPIALASGDPIAAHQTTLLATFAGAFLTAFALVYAWTRAWPAAAVAGMLYAYSPFRATHLAALHVEAAWLLPLVVLCAERACATSGAGAVLALAAVLALQALSSYYLGYAAFVAIAVVTVVVATMEPSARSHAGRLVVGIAGAALIVGTISVPYLLARRAGALDPPNPAFVAWASAHPGKTGASRALLLATLTLPWWRRGLRPGLGVGWLIAVAAAGIVAHLLALGPRIEFGGASVPGPFALATAIVPGWQLMRAPVRLNVVTTMAAAVLAGVGTAGVVRTLTLRAPRGGRLAAAAALALALVSVRATMPWPVPLAPVDGSEREPAVYGWLARAAPGPVLEVPFHDFHGDGAGRDVEARRLRRSVRHWHPLLGGYSGYVPPTYAAVSALARATPDARALELLQRITGLRWIVVHRAELPRDGRRRWAAARALLRPVAVIGSDVVFVPRARVDADLELAFVSATGAATPLGTPLRPLDPSDLRGDVVMDPAPTRMPWLDPIEIAVRVTNEGRAVWPAMGTGPLHLVTIGHRWIAGDGHVVAEQADAGRLPWDLGPGASVRARAVVTPPREPGVRALAVGLVQDGRWLDGVASRCFAPTGTAIDCSGAR